jgi:hypothetical protein
MFCSANIDWSATAAWAQAILSALAIFAAVWLQDRDRRIRAEERQRSRRTAILTVAKNCVGTLEQLDRRARDRRLTLGRFGFYEDELEADLAAMTGLDLLEIGDAKLMAELMRVRRLAKTARRRLGYQREKVEKGEIVKPSHFSSTYRQAKQIVNGMAPPTDSEADKLPTEK